MATTTKTRKTKTTTKVDVAETVTNLIIEQLEAGVVPWHQPWQSTGGALPRSMSTGRAYRGVNSLLLSMYGDMAGYSSPWWGTYKQIAALGGQVRKGEHGSTIVLYKTFTKTETDAKGDEVERRIPIMRAFVVFNAGQADGLPERYTAVTEAVTNQHDRIEVAESIVAGYVMGEGPRVEHGGDRACYSPLLDLVRLPELASFDSPEAYYSTTFHELTHSTGHSSRLDREGIAGLLNGHAFGSPLYAAEELVAEMGAAMLCAAVGIEQAAHVPQSASYIDNWLTVLKGDTKLVLKAAAAAQRAVDLIVPDDDETADDAAEVAD